mgnify:CR=1 FL=1
MSYINEALNLELVHSRSWLECNSSIHKNVKIRNLYLKAEFFYGNRKYASLLLMNVSNCLMGRQVYWN